MKALRLALLFPVAIFASCSTSVDEYNYGYAPAYRTLPEGFEQAQIGGQTYWHHGGRFYEQDGEKGYLLVKPPRGHEAVVSSGETPTPSGSPVAAEPQRKSWITPGGGTVNKTGMYRNIGRSPIRRQRTSLN
jgi:hypothetical protein